MDSEWASGQYGDPSTSPLKVQGDQNLRPPPLPPGRGHQWASTRASTTARATWCSGCVNSNDWCSDQSHAAPGGTRYSPYLTTEWNRTASWPWFPVGPPGAPLRDDFPVPGDGMVQWMATSFFEKYHCSTTCSSRNSSTSPAVAQNHRARNARRRGGRKINLLKL